jgi:FolB domain-containing protein
VTARAFELAGEAAAGIRVVLGIPKMILLASGFTVDLVSEKIGSSFAGVSKKVSVQDIVVSVIIGVNPPEREEKQRVLVNVIFHEDPSFIKNVDYPRIISKLSKEMETSSYLTLEKFVMQIIRTSCLEHGNVRAVTVRAQKPSALSFAGSAGVEITRTPATFR